MTSRVAVCARVTAADRADNGKKLDRGVLDGVVPVRNAGRDRRFREAMNVGVVKRPGPHQATPGWR